MSSFPGMHYIEVNGELKEASLDEFIVWVTTADRQVWRTEQPGVEVSTVFMGINHAFYPDDRTPVLYETMVFASPNEEMVDYTDRYHTREEAIRGHAEILRRMGVHDKPPEFKAEPIENQISRIQLLLGEE